MANFLKLSFLLFSVSLVCSIPIPEDYHKSFDVLNGTGISPVHIVYETKTKVDYQESVEHQKKSEKNDFDRHSRKLLINIKSMPASILASAKTFPIYMTCDNEFNLYVNSVKVGSGNSWTTTYHFAPLVKPGDVIAIDGIDRGGPAAFIGVFDGKVTKASDWKCSTKEVSGWTKNDFNDATWAQATSYSKNKDSNIWRSVGGGSRPNIPGDAEWLWTNDNNNHNRVFCRYIKIQPQATPKATPPAAPVSAPKATPPAAPVAAPVGKQQISIKKDEDKLKQLLKDSKDTHGFSREKLQNLKKNILQMIDDEKKSKEVELKEFQKTILFSEQDLKKLNKKYDDKVAEYVTLNKTITKLEKTMQQHYKQMLSDAKYLLILEKIKPNFLQTLTVFNQQVRTIKDTIQVNIVDGDDKTLMLRIIYEMNEKTTNYTSVLSNEFIKHYEKYKRLSGLDKAEYDNEYKQLEILKTKYEGERKLRDNYLTEYENAMKVLKKLQSNYNLDSEDIQSFKQIGVFIENIFHNSKC